jgi:osmotically-inducible protein OsmY
MPAAEIPASVHISTLGTSAEARLRGSSYRALHEVSCIGSGEVVYLYGCLPSQYLKQIAQQMANDVEGVRLVVNRIEVISPSRNTHRN